MSRRASLTTVTLLVAGLCVWEASVAGQRGGPSDRIACSVETSSFFSFGSYDPFRPSATDVQGQMTYRCYEVNQQVVTSRLSTRRTVRATSVDVEVSINRGSSGTFDRKMRGANDEVRYNLYLDAARTRIWGDGAGGTSVHAKRVPLNNTQTVPIYGRMPAGQDATGGTYADVLVITIDF